ncbi:hypothetical protein AMTRI_Chr02g212380 [Amborella trichopoda]|uniref:Glycosyltransferase n=1 Tax=Amborella trichopoda TaxID=13333 RepID=W1NU70_AMBTC|nr:putative UDP-rhamnose:rhamnosyltransferase 1 [Amborella trichopoda]ERM99147.1 hypothetical protein AMTR_s00092p00017910 [Amborella trichopoda]|eukprot:XP_006836294.1 putative UDP-rhamnose:rhamnosyltransferase 1 [Amborella trichopoda]
MDNPDNRRHFLLFPWLAFGHILPFFHLAKRLADAKISVTFLAPASVLPRLPSLHLPHHLSLISFHPFSLPHVPDLPPEAATTSDLPPHLQSLLKSSLDLLQPLLHSILSKLPLNLVIQDFAPYWLPKIAAKFGVPTAYFSIFNAASVAYFMVPSRRVPETPPPSASDLSSPPFGFPSSSLYVQRYEAEQLLWIYTYPEPDISGIDRLLRTISNSNMVIVRSCYELEGKYFEYLEKEFQSHANRESSDRFYKNIGNLNFLPVGFLSPRLGDEAPRDNSTGIDGGSSVEKSWTECLDWLDKQPFKSVVYVAFGTEWTLTPSQTRAVALGLESSGARFLWIKRTPRYAPSEASDGLPEGFVDRVHRQGLVFKEWVPQSMILAHPSVGVFFSHSGTSSVIEGLATGKRLVLLPLVFDQGLIARLVANEWKAAIEIEGRSLEDGNFTSELINRAIVRVVMEAEDTETWINAKDLQARVFGNMELQDKYIKLFVDHVDTLVCCKKE